MGAGGPRLQSPKPRRLKNFETTAPAPEKTPTHCAEAPKLPIGRPSFSADASVAAREPLGGLQAVRRKAGVGADGDTPLFEKRQQPFSE